MRQKKAVRVLSVMGAIAIIGIGYVRARADLTLNPPNTAIAPATDETRYRDAESKFELNRNFDTIRKVVDALEYAPTSHAVVREVAHLAISRGPDIIDGATSMGISQMMLQEKIVNQNAKLIAQNERLISLHEKEVELLTQISKKK